MGEAGHGSRLGMAGRLLYALDSNRVPFEMIVDADEHEITRSPYDLEWTSRVIQWFDYFLLGKGDNPLPAMRSPYNYSELTKELKALP